MRKRENESMLLLLAFQICGSGCILWSFFCSSRGFGVCEAWIIHSYPIRYLRSDAAKQNKIGSYPERTLFWTQEGQKVTTLKIHGKTRSTTLLRANAGDESSLEDFPAKVDVQVSIEYCTGCRWGLRSFWMAQELLMTFQEEEGGDQESPFSLSAITLIPSRPPEPGGRFVIQYHRTPGVSSYGDSNDRAKDVQSTLLWDRKIQGGFPELKDLKQLVRDEIYPQRFLGHSESTPGLHRTISSDSTSAAAPARGSRVVLPSLYRTKAPHVAIIYCTGCRWLLRAAYCLQELMSTFDAELGSVSLIPCRPPSKGGTFRVLLDDQIVWDRAEEGRFPEITQLKQRVRDRLDPSKDLGHSDTSETKVVDESEKPLTNAMAIDEIDDEEAEEARRFFGVL